MPPFRNSEEAFYSIENVLLFSKGFLNNPPKSSLVEDNKCKSPLVAAAALRMKIVIRTLP
jgi:hypothetical protein